MLNTCRPTRRERHRRYGWRGLLRPRAALLRVSAPRPRFARTDQPPKAEPTVRALTLDLLYVACVARVYKNSLAACPVVDVEGYGQRSPVRALSCVML